MRDLGGITAHAVKPALAEKGMGMVSLASPVRGSRMTRDIRRARVKLSALGAVKVSVTLALSLGAIVLLGALLETAMTSAGFRPCRAALIEGMEGEEKVVLKARGALPVLDTTRAHLKGSCTRSRGRVKLVRGAAEAAAAAAASIAWLVVGGAAEEGREEPLVGGLDFPPAEAASAAACPALASKAAVSAALSNLTRCVT